MHSICLIHVQVAVKREGWMILVIDKYKCWLILIVRVAYGETSIKTGAIDVRSTGRSCSKAFWRLA